MLQASRDQSKTSPGRFRHFMTSPSRHIESTPIGTQVGNVSPFSIRFPTPEAEAYSTSLTRYCERASHSG